MSEIDRGYSITEQLFAQREMVSLRETLERVGLPRSRAGTRHLLHVPAVRDLASHSRLVNLAASFIGPRPVAFRATLFDKSATSNWMVAWHQDTALPLHRRSENPAWGPWSIKRGVLHAIAPAAALSSVVALRVHLDASTDTNGPLRVLPGTHEGGILSRDDIVQCARTIRPVECLAPVGGVIAMRPLLVHASLKTSDGRPRRVLHLEYTSTVHFDESGIELAVG
jgi:hypothetical protein